MTNVVYVKIVKASSLPSVLECNGKNMVSYKCLHFSKPRTEELF